MVQSPIFVIACRSSVLTSPHVQVHDNGEGLIDAMPASLVGGCETAGTFSSATSNLHLLLGYTLADRDARL
jgi:hypothetical protein